MIFYLNPVANAGIDQKTCANTLTLNGNTLPNGMGQWTVSAGNPANISIGQAGDPMSTVTGLSPGSYTLSWTLTQNGCVGTDQVDIQFNTIPTLGTLLRTCDALNENFTVTFNLNGGTPPYAVNGNAIAGASFTSAAFANGQNYTFNVSDANGCAMPAITGAYSCIAPQVQAPCP